MVLKPSSSRKIPNLFLRKRRKFTHSPYKTRWHYIFNQQQALQTLKNSSYSSTIPHSTIRQSTLNLPKTPSHLLDSLINSFNSYRCDPTPNAYHFIIKTLIQKSQLNELGYVLIHLENDEKIEFPEWVFVELIRAFGEKGMITEAIDLFFRIPKFRCVPTVVSLNALLLILCRNRECLRIVPQLLLKSTIMNIRMEGSSFSILINALCRVGRVDSAVKLLSYMVCDEFDPDGKLYSLVLESLCREKTGNVACFEMMGVWEDMKRSGFCPGREDYCNVIKFLGRQGKGREAFDVLCEVKREGIKPDIMSYTLAICGLVEEGFYSRVEELFDEILIFGLVPNVATYNVYLKGLGKQGKAEDAFRMISYMEELGCPPDLITYNRVLEAFCKVEDLSRARKVWSEMNKKGIELNDQSYRLIIDALVTGGEVIDACNILEHMLSKGLLPLSSTLHNIICSLCHKGLVSDALHTLEKVSAYGVLPGSMSWEALLLELNPILDDTCDVLKIKE